MVLKVDPAFMNFAIPMRNVKRACQVLRPYQHMFNRLSVDDTIEGHEATKAVRVLNKINEAIGQYGAWKATSLIDVDVEKSREIMKSMFDFSTALNEGGNTVVKIDPRKLLNLDVIENEFVKIVTHLWFTLHCNNPQTGSDMPLLIYQKCIVKIVWNIVTLLDRAALVFAAERCIQPFSMFGFTIHPGTEGDNARTDPEHEHIPLFTLHDKVVAFTDDEIAEIEHQKQVAAEEEAHQQEIEAARNAVREHAELIMKCYDRHINLGNLTKFKLSEYALRVLKHPEDEEQCAQAESFFRFLTTMANTSRCMPGDTMSDTDKIMGSFMELEKDVMTYKLRFVLNMEPGVLEHNDIVNALPFIPDGIRAQYVDTKEFIESPSNKSASYAAVHLFVE